MSFAGADTATVVLFSIYSYLRLRRTLIAIALCGGPQPKLRYAPSTIPSSDCTNDWPASQPHTRGLATGRTSASTHEKIAFHEQSSSMSHRDVAFRAAFWTDPDQRHAALRAAAAAYDRAWRADPFKPNVLSGADTAEERHDLRWDEDLTVRHAIRNGGCTLIRMADPLVRSDRRSWASLGFPWASGQLLDACAGQNLASWLVRVDCSEGNRGFICIGVCEPTACCAWGLSLCTGMLERNTRGLDGRFAGDAPHVAAPFWPDGDGTQVLHDAEGRPAHMQGKAVGSVIRVIVDREAGTLAFSVNGGAPLVALTGFPQNTPLRPWALLGYSGDAITISGYSESGGGPRPETIEQVLGPPLLNGLCPALSDSTCRAPTYWSLGRHAYRIYDHGDE